MISFESFCKRFKLMTEDAFMATVKVPHLYIPTLSRQEQEGFATVQFDPERIAQERDEAMVLPIQKREDGNAFGIMITLGRATNNDLVINDSRISKFHAYFRQVGDEWSVSDANSRNGTSVDGIELAPETSHPLSSGAEITLAKDLDLVFLQPQDLYRRVYARNTR